MSRQNASLEGKAAPVPPVRSGTCSAGEADEAIRAIHAAPSCLAFSEILEEQARAILRAERATFFRLERRDKIETLVSVRETERPRVRFPIGEGIAGTVARENGYYLCNDPEKDELYLPAVDGYPGLRVVNVLSTAMAAQEEDLVGVLQVWNGRKRGFKEDDAYWLQKLAEHAALAYARLRRLEDGWNLVRNLAAMLADAVDDKHVSTVGHADRTRQIALAIGRNMNLTGDELLELELAALLHDAGRLALSPEAFEWAGGPGGAAKGYAAEGERLHVVLTETLLRDLKLPEYLVDLPEIALAHHEKADGSGFPRGKRGSEMPLGARILAVANAFDMLSSGRAAAAKGQRLDDEQAAAWLKAQAGKTFDASVVNRLLKRKLYQVEKRRYPRYDFEAPIEVSVLGAPGARGQAAARTFETQVVELSEGGILFRSEEKLPAHALLRMRIHLPTETLDALARVARHLPDPEAKGYKVGAYFLWYGTQREETQDR